MPSFLPGRESLLVTWGRNFEPLIAADPTAYGLTAEQATAYSAVHAAFDAAYQTANDRLTRSPANIEIKNTAKGVFIAETRRLVKIIQAFPGITNGQRSSLGINVPDPNPTPVPPPSESPTIVIESVSGHTVKLRLQTEEANSRAKPVGVQGAYVYTFVGDAPPAEIKAWHFEGSTSTTETAVEFSTDLPVGTKVWFTASWINAKLQTGPACVPQSTQINYGGLTQAA